MSAKHLAAAADIQGLPPTCKLVMYALAMAADWHGYARVTNAQLQRLTGLSERAVRQNCRHLQSLGIILPIDKHGYRFIMGDLG